MNSSVSDKYSIDISLFNNPKHKNLSNFKSSFLKQPFLHDKITYNILPSQAD